MFDCIFNSFFSKSIPHRLAIHYTLLWHTVKYGAKIHLWYVCIYDVSKLDMKDKTMYISSCIINGTLEREKRYANIWYPIDYVEK